VKIKQGVVRSGKKRKAEVAGKSVIVVIATSNANRVLRRCQRRRPWSAIREEEENFDWRGGSRCGYAGSDEETTAQVGQAAKDSGEEVG
jgi:hypothetical protein